MSRSACEVCGETYDYCGQCGTCHKCMGEDIDRLKAELESKDKAIKLLQGHCNALMDTEGKLAQWKKGHAAGQEAAGYYQKQADDMIRQLRKELSDENANFTEEIMNLERQLDASQALLAEARAEVERLSLENRQMLQGMKWDNQLKSEARQEVARGCIEAIEAEYGILGLAYTLRQRFGLER